MRCKSCRNWVCSNFINICIETFTGRTGTGVMINWNNLNTIIIKLFHWLQRFRPHGQHIQVGQNFQQRQAMIIHNRNKHLNVKIYIYFFFHKLQVYNGSCILIIFTDAKKQQRKENQSGLKHRKVNKNARLGRKAARLLTDSSLLSGITLFMYSFSNNIGTDENARIWCE